MAGFSIGAAIRDGLGLIRQRPLSVFVWGLLIMAPTGVAFGIMWPMMGEMAGAMSDTGGDTDFPKAAFANMIQLQATSALLNIVQLLVIVVVYTAVMRAALRPAENRFFSLRLGMDELRIGIVGLALVVVLYIAMIVLVLLGVAVGFAIWGAGPPLNWLSIVGLVVTAVLLLFVGMARVSLIAPASVLHRDFAFVEGWRLARGQTGRLLAMMVLLVLMVVLIEVVVVAIGVGVASVLSPSGLTDWNTPRFEADGANPFASLSAMFAANWGWFALAALVAAAVYGVVMTLQIAAFASACRQLTGSRPAPSLDQTSPAAAM